MRGQFVLLSPFYSTLMQRRLKASNRKRHEPVAMMIRDASAKRVVSNNSDGSRGAIGCPDEDTRRVHCTKER